MKIICTLNLKGGCAKTTTAVSMAELLATGFKSKHGTVKPGKVNPGREERIINEILSEHPEKREIKQAIINLSCGQTGNKKIESMEDTLEIINATLGGMVKGNELTVEQSAAVLTVAMKAYEVGKKARIKA